MTRLTDIRTTRLMDTHFENNLAHAVCYNPRFKSISGRIFKLETRKHNMDGRAHATILIVIPIAVGNEIFTC